MNDLSPFLDIESLYISEFKNKAKIAILDDMNRGLNGLKSDEDMIPTWCMPPKSKVVNKSVIVIDAGGTNFRSCLVTFDANGVASISEMEKTKMPGVEKELSKKEFFDQFDCIFVDEVHKGSCVSIQKILDSCNFEYKFGLSGTIPNMQTAEGLTLCSSLGPIVFNITAAKLQDEG